MPSTALKNPPVSAVPASYYIMFGVIEPILAFVSFLEGILDPAKVINRRGPWPNNFTGVSSAAAHEVVCQIALAHVIIGFINASVLRAIRRLPSQALQEKIAKSLLIPLAIGDVSYLFSVLYGTSDVRWKLRDQPQVPWLNVIVGFGFFVARVCWLIGIGRYVATRDSRLDSRN